MKSSYLLVASQFCPENCHYCPTLGYCHESKELEQINFYLSRAFLEPNSPVYIPCNLIFLPETQFDEIIERAKKYDLEVIVQINVRTLNETWFELLKKLKQRDLKLQLIFGDHLLKLLPFLFADDFNGHLDTHSTAEAAKSLINIINLYFDSVLFIINKNLQVADVTALVDHFNIPLFYKILKEEAREGIFKKNFEVQNQLIELKKIEDLHQFLES